MIHLKGVACMFMAALALPSCHAAKLQPDDDGMSLSAAFHAKLSVMHSKNMESMESSAKKSPPPPPAGGSDSVPSIPCYQGGDDCSDYEKYSPCTNFKCKKEEEFPYCESVGGKEGTICGADGDYFEFDVCNKGPGFCKNIESDYGDFGLCLGIPKLGAACNDYDDCTKDDKCKVVITNDGQAFRGQCMGKFAGEIPCNDYNDDCTSNDRCQLVHSEEGDVALCRGDFNEGPCNDYNDCTDHDVCSQNPPEFPPFDDGVRCKGKLASGKSCNDYNNCTDHDECTEVTYYDYTFATCRGTALPDGTECDDYFDGTVNDACKAYDYGTYCVGDYNP